MSSLLPSWMEEEPCPVPGKGQDGFITRSLLAFVRLFERIDLNKRADSEKAHAGVKLLTAFSMILMMALSPAFGFTLCIAAVFLLFLSMQRLEVLQEVMRSAAGAAMLSFLILVPAYFLSGSMTFITISVKVFLSVAMLTYVSVTSPWNRLTASLNRIHIPSIVVFILDLTLRYIAILGRKAEEMLTALCLRSIGKSEDHRRSFSGIAGTLFLKAAEYGHQTADAMECRLYDGTIHTEQRSCGNAWDIALLAVLGAFVLLFLYSMR